jgi:hypothetical protein
LPDLIENRLEALTRSLALKEVMPRPEPVVDEQVKTDDGEAEDVHS